MATTHARRSPTRSNERSPRQAGDDHCRNCALADCGSAKPGQDYCYHGDERPSRRYQENKTSGHRRQGETQSDHELYKVPEERTSDEESLTEAETIDTAQGDARPTYRDFDSDPRKFEKSPRDYSKQGYSRAPESRQMAQYEDVEVAAAPPPCQRNLRDYVNSVTLPQALMAARKLERLKELQRRREYSERFYSHEIKRLIGEVFFGKNSAVDPATEKIRLASGNRTIGDTSNVEQQRIRAGGFSKELKACGTMTTITRLDCGCVRETTTPILNGPTGRVKQCEGHRYQKCIDPKLAPPSPQELTYRAAQPLDRFANVPTSPTRAKAGKFPPESAARRKLQITESRDLEWENRRSHSALRRSPRHVSPVRNASPLRKYSDTSTNSPGE